MIHLPKDETKTMVAVHGWSGIVLGLLLYAVVLTGTAAVFAKEVGIWSAGHVATGSAFERPITQALRDAGARTPAKYHDGVDLFEVGDHELGAFFHRHEMRDGDLISRGVFYRVDRDGRIAERREGTGEEVYGPRNDNALSDFLVDTHVRLHVPNPWGLLLTGILGLTMLVAAISGLLIHRHLFKDVFTLRRKGSAMLMNRDRHSVAGTWSLPFAFILAFTGSFFSFFGTIGVPIVAMAAFGGDVQALQKAVFGNPEVADPRPAPIGDFDRITADSIARAGDAPTFVSVEHFGRSDMTVMTYHPPREGSIAPMSLLYDGATARFERVKPQIGSGPSAGGMLAALMSPLHFGNFAGMLSKAVWFGLGFAMCYVTFTGLRLWLVKREAKARSLGWLDRLVVIVGLGLPAALLACAAAFLIAMPSGNAVYWTPAGFVIASVAVILGGFLWPTSTGYGRLLRLVNAGLMLALPPLRLAMGGPGWGAAIAAGQPVIAALDLAFVLAGGWIAWQAIGARTPRPGTSLPALQPAE